MPSEPRRARKAAPRVKMPTVKPRRGGGFNVVIECGGATRKHADHVAKMVRSYLRASQQSGRGGFGEVRLHDMSDVLYSLGLVLNLRMVPKETGTDSPAGASVPAVDRSRSYPTTETSPTSEPPHAE